MSDKQKSHKSTIYSPLVPPGYKQTEVGVITDGIFVFKYAIHQSILKE